MDRAIRRTDGWRGYGWALLVSAVGTAGGWLLYHGFAPPDAGRQPRLANTNVLMLYLLGVLWVATRYGRGPSLVASIFGVAAFDFCFVPPYLRFAVEDKQYVITFAVMLLTAITISTLTHRVRQHARSAKDAWERAETEFLRNTLLSGVSHDLRTPLAAITGAASSLLETGEKLPSAARADMLALIVEEAERMERLVNNLLEITRLESGGLALKPGPLHLQDVVGASIPCSVKGC